MIYLYIYICTFLIRPRHSLLFFQSCSFGETDRKHTQPPPRPPTTHLSILTPAHSRETIRMRFHVVTSLLALASTTSAAITWTLQKAANPTTDQADAYSKIEAAMKLAVAHYAKFSDATKKLTIQYEVSPC